MPQLQCIGISCYITAGLNPVLHVPAKYTLMARILLLPVNAAIATGADQILVA